MVRNYVVNFHLENVIIIWRYTFTRCIHGQYKCLDIIKGYKGIR